MICKGLERGRLARKEIASIHKYYGQIYAKDAGGPHCGNKAKQKNLDAPINQPIIDEDDLDFIDTVLEKYGSEDSLLNASEVDGFLTAIVSGPDMIMPSEWLPAVWGGEDEAPEWESEVEVTRFMNLVLTMMNQNVDVSIVFELPAIAGKNNARLKQIPPNPPFPKGGNKIANPP